MARRIAAIAAVACSLLLAQSQPDSIVLLTTGSFHGNEVQARSGEQWLGLLPESSGFAWKPVTLTTRRVIDPFVDEAGKETGIEVSVADDDPVFLIKGAAGLLGNKVSTVLHDPEGLSFAEKDPLEFALPGHAPYRISVVHGQPGSDSPGKASLLILESGGLRQVLYEWTDGFIDQHCELLWAGDLDGDGRLDLFLNLSGHYNVMERTLFLSSGRSEGDLVKRIAVFRTVGC